MIYANKSKARISDSCKENVCGELGFTLAVISNLFIFPGLLMVTMGVGRVQVLSYGMISTIQINENYVRNDNTVIRNHDGSMLRKDISLAIPEKFDSSEEQEEKLTGRPNHEGFRDQDMPFDPLHN